MMKRKTLWVLILLLVCRIGAALAQEGFMLSAIQNDEGHSEVFRSVAAGDAVYLLSTQRNLYVLNTETQQAALLPMHNMDSEYQRVPETALAFYQIAKDEPVPEWLREAASAIDMLFLDGDRLYGINELNGALYRVEMAENAASLHALSVMDFSSEDEKENIPSISSGMVCNGTLYVMMCLTAEEAQPSAYRFDMTTGTREPIKGQDRIVEMTRYQDGRLLFLEEAPDSQWRVIDYDPATESRRLLFESGKADINSENVLGLLYDPWQNRILIQADRELLSLSGKNALEAVAYLPSIWAEGRAISRDGLLVLLDHETVYAVPTLQKEPLARTLQVACNDLEDWMYQGFSKAYPNIPVKHRQVYEHEAIKLFAEQMTARSDEIDIFEIPIGSAAQNAIEKGYYHPLNQSQAICEKVAAYRPFFQHTVVNGDEIVGVLRKTEQYTLGYSKHALAQLGLTAADVPSGFMEWMDFLLEWDERVGEVAQQAEITPFGIENEQLKAELFAMLLDQYYLLMEDNAANIPLYETELAELLDKLSAVCTSLPDDAEEEAAHEPFERFARIRVDDQPSYLFNRYCSFLPGRRHFSNGSSISDFVPMALTLPSQTLPLLLFEGTLFIVNPYSAQKEQALQWLAFYTSHMPAKDAATFDRDASPLAFEAYEAMKEYYTEEMTKMEGRIKAAGEVEKHLLQSQLQLMQQTLGSLERLKWEVSMEHLADYEQILIQSTAVWDRREAISAFGKTYTAYLTEGLPGKKVARAFFAAYQMVLKEARWKVRCGFFHHKANRGGGPCRLQRILSASGEVCFCYLA